MNTFGVITAEQHRAIALILQGKAAIYDGEHGSIVDQLTGNRPCTS